MWKSSKTLKTKFPQGFIKIVLSTNIWVWIFNSFCGQKEKKGERRKKEGKQERVGGREGGKAGRETGRKESGGGGKKRKYACLFNQDFICVTPLKISVGNRPMTSILLNLVVFPVFSCLILQQNLTPWSFPPQNTFFTKTQPFFGFLIASQAISSLPLHLVPKLLPDCLMAKCPCLLLWVYPHSLPPDPDLVVRSQDLPPTWQQLSNSSFCPDLSPDLVS